MIRQLNPCFYSSIGIFVILNAIRIGLRLLAFFPISTVVQWSHGGKEQYFLKALNWDSFGWLYHLLSFQKAIFVCFFISIKLYFDVVTVSEHHRQTVNSKTPACCWWKPIFECCAEVLVDQLCLIIACFLCLQIIYIFVSFWVSQNKCWQTFAC